VLLHGELCDAVVDRAKSALARSLAHTLMGR
jgi:hypothetical protein